MKVRRLGMHFAGMVLRGAGILCRRPLHILARATVAGAGAERKHRIEDWGLTDPPLVGNSREGYDWRRLAMR